MALLPYKASAWATHRESKFREIATPFFNQGEPTHFTVRRTYTGPAETYVPADLNDLDPIYNGVALSFTGANSGDLLTFAAAHLLRTGDPVTLTVSTGLTGLTTATVYYYIRLSTTTGQLATTRALAAAGTATTFSADGTGTLTPPTAYLVEQSPLTDADAGQVSYSRLFATVPAQWSDPADYAYEFPAYTGASTAGTAYAVTGLSSAIVGGVSTIIITNATSSGIAPGDTVFVSIRYTRSSTKVSLTTTALAIATTNSTTTTIAGVLLGTGTISAISGTVMKSTSGRLLPESIIAAGRIVRDYALSTAANLATDLPLNQRFVALDATGNKTDTLTTLTFPTSANYAALADGGGELIVKCVWARYLGNIYCRETQLVPAL